MIELMAKIKLYIFRLLGQTNSVQFQRIHLWRIIQQPNTSMYMYVL